jgi:hypothetical protein
LHNEAKTNLAREHRRVKALEQQILTHNESLRSLKSECSLKLEHERARSLALELALYRLESQAFDVRKQLTTSLSDLKISQDKAQKSLHECRLLRRLIQESKNEINLNKEMYGARLADYKHAYKKARDNHEAYKKMFGDRVREHATFKDIMDNLLFTITATNAEDLRASKVETDIVQAKRLEEADNYATSYKKSYERLHKEVEHLNKEMLQFHGENAHYKEYLDQEEKELESFTQEMDDAFHALHQEMDRDDKKSVSQHKAHDTKEREKSFKKVEHALDKHAAQLEQKLEKHASLMP